MFHIGFNKIATDGHNNQGLEFKTSDTENTTGNVGPGGMSPQGIDSYQPAPEQPSGKPKKKKGMDVFETAQFLMTSKVAKVESNLARGGGSIADGIVTGLKYDSSSVDAEHGEVSDKIQAEKNRLKKYVKAGLR